MVKRLNFGSAVLAGFIATLITTVLMAFFGWNMIGLLGKTAGMGGASVYLVGGIIHFVIGIIYAIIYAAVFEPLFHKMPKYLSGMIYGLLPFVVAVLFLPTGLHSLACVFKAPGCQKFQKEHMKMGESSQGCTPCQKKQNTNTTTVAPAGKTQLVNPQTPAGQFPASLLLLLKNLVFGFFLGLMYRPKKIGKGH